MFLNGKNSFVNQMISHATQKKMASTQVAGVMSSIVVQVILSLNFYAPNNRTEIAYGGPNTARHKLLQKNQLNVLFHVILKLHV